MKIPPAPGPPAFPPASSPSTASTEIVNLRVYCSGVLRIDRTSIMGNPFSHQKGSRALVIVPTREDSVRFHLIWLQDGMDCLLSALPPEISKVLPDYLIRELAFRREVILRNLESLRGQKLGCWCKPKPCHGDNYLILLDCAPAR